mgnify:CR=1 FL=1
MNAMQREPVTPQPSATLSELRDAFEHNRILIDRFGLSEGMDDETADALHASLLYDPVNRLLGTEPKSIDDCAAILSALHFQLEGAGSDLEANAVNAILNFIDHHA